MGQLSALERWWVEAWPHRLHIRRFIPRFLRLCPEPFRGEVLEVGAGRGWTSQRILETFPQVELTAIDIDPAVVVAHERLRQRYGRRLNVQRADILHLPFDRNSFDIVVAMHVMHHIDDIPGAVEQLLRVARPGGLVGITGEDLHYVLGMVRRLWRSEVRVDRAGLEQALDRAGAEIVLARGVARFLIWARKPYATGSPVPAERF